MSGKKRKKYGFSRYFERDLENGEGPSNSQQRGDRGQESGKSNRGEMHQRDDRSQERWRMNEDRSDQSDRPQQRGKRNRGRRVRSQERWRMNGDELDQSSDRSQGRERPPPHLRGREIGMWFCRRNKARKNKNLDTMTEEERLKFEMRKEALKARKQAKNMEKDKKPLATIFLANPTRTKIEKFLEETRDNYTTITRHNSYEHLKDTDFKHNFLTHITGNLEKKLSQAHDDMLPPRNPILDEDLYHEYLDKQTNEKYKVMQKIRERLPSMKMREEIIRVIESNQVVVISGETGCGKTTQVSQFILDHYIQQMKGSLCRIICTQPRRISAIGVSERVAQERAEKLGQSVGFQIRLEKTLPRDQGSVLFCTTGVLVKFMEGNLLLEGVSHIILDEIHERDIISDFLITLLKDIITVRKDLKVILMSATLNSDAFSIYYNHAPCLNIPGFTFPVQEYFLEDILEKTKFSFRVAGNTYDDDGIIKKQQERRQYIEPWVRQIESEGKYDKRVTMELMKIESERLNLDLIFQLLQYVIKTEDDDGAVLIFVTGFSDIQFLTNAMMRSKNFPRSKYIIVPLHSQLDTVDQKQVFNPAPLGKRKIIVSTNIAETSITIDDVTTVINCGFIKMTSLHEDFGYETLKAEFVSKANAGQRRGRAGRVKPGVCYHLITRGRYNILEQFQKPEILRRRLEDVVLSVKMLQLGKAAPFLAKLMDPPDSAAVQSSVALLERLGALDDEENLTPLGYHMAHLPVGAQPAKMLILGCIFSCLDPILSIAATIGYKEPFQISSDDPKLGDMARIELSNGCKSDHILMHLAIKGFQQAEQQNSAWEFCRRYFLSNHTLRLLKDMRRQFAEQLYDMKFLVSKNPTEPCHNMNSENWSLIKAVICAGLYPNIFICNPKRMQILRTVNHEKMSFHPKCLLSKEKKEGFDSPIGVYHQRLKTKCLNIYDATLVRPYPLVFFGDNYKISAETNPHTVLINEGRMAFKCKKESAETIKKMRNRLSQILEHMISHPGAVEWSKSTVEVQFLRILMDLVTKEDLDEWDLSDFEDDDKNLGAQLKVSSIDSDSE